LSLYFNVLFISGKTVPSEERPSIGNEPSSTYNGSRHLEVNESADFRRRSWGDKDEEQSKPEYQHRVSTSLDDLSASEPVKKVKDPARSRTQVISLPKDLTKEEESNKLADILDSIKSEEKDDRKGFNGQSRNANCVSMQGKSYSYSCLATLPLDDG